MSDELPDLEVVIKMVGTGPDAMKQLRAQGVATKRDLQGATEMEKDEGD
jgi:hypothetical protein